MVSRFKLAAFAAISLSSAASAYAASDPAGTWLTEDGRAKVKVEKCGADHQGLCGTVVWLKEPNDEKGHPKTDTKNPDPAKRTRPAVGIKLFEDLKLNDDEAYAGQIYNADNGKMYDITIRNEDADQLKIHGCMLAVLCGSQDWKRVAEVPATVVATTQGKKPKAAPAQ